MKLVIDNVSKNFIDPQGKQLSVLENVSLTVHSEEFVALVGPSGCGKSTLLNLTAGLLSPSDGSIYFTDLTDCLLYTSPSPRDGLLSRMPSSA